MNLSDKLRELDAIIVTHTFATGPAQELEVYLKSMVRRLLFIGHPFCFSSDTRSFLREYQQGKLVKERQGIRWRLPQILMYFKDAVYTLFWLGFIRGRFDLYIGADNLNAAMGVILKRLGKVEKVVFYTIDYVPYRFKNKILNKLYHRLDRFCLRHCHYVWNLSPLMAEGRKKRGTREEGIATQLVVPGGVNFHRIERLPLERIDRHSMVFLGHLRENQGLELLINALHAVTMRIADIKLLVIGAGPLELRLKEMATEPSLSEHITFTGYIEDHREVDKIMASCAIGVAPYEPDPKSFTYYSDPGKLKQYMACGLPVITTRVAWIAEEIKKRPIGIVIEYSKSELIDAIIKLLEDDDFYQQCRRNAIEFASTLSWDKIFDEALSEILLRRSQ